MNTVQIKTLVKQGHTVYCITPDNHVIMDGDQFFIERIETGDRLPLLDNNGLLMAAEYDFFTEKN